MIKSDYSNKKYKMYLFTYMPISFVYVAYHDKKFVLYIATITELHSND